MSKWGWFIAIGFMVATYLAYAEQNAELKDLKLQMAIEDVR